MCSGNGREAHVVERSRQEGEHEMRAVTMGCERSKLCSNLQVLPVKLVLFNLLEEEVRGGNEQRSDML